MSEMDIETSVTVGELFTALSKAQGELGAAKKDSINPHFRSKFADLASVIEACKGPLAKHDLCVIQVTHAKDAEGVLIVTTLGHKSGEWMRGRLYMPNSKKDAQGMGSAITYGRRYSYQSMVGLAAEEDDDGNEAARKPAGPNAEDSRKTLAEMEGKLLDAKDVDSLKSIAKEAEGKLTEADRMALSKLYVQRKKELEAAK